jgi:hypothetical protein
MSRCVDQLKRAIWIVCVVIGTAATVEGAAVTLAWNPNPEPDVEGYIVSYGTSSGQYTTSVPVGNTTSHTITNLFTGQTYYFALQAVNASGPSSYSTEVSTTLASPLSVVNLTADRPSPQPVGTTITFSATANGGTPPYQFKWWIVNGATQSVGSNWSTNSNFAWTPTVASPSYTIRVWARNASSTTDAPDNSAATLEMTFAITSSSTNTAPMVNAGADRSITLPSNTTLTATVSDDGQPTPPALTLSWIRVSGPGTVTFSAPASATTTASFSAAGTYVLRLTASDGALATSDDVTVTVVAPTGNTAPTVNAGADRSITLPGNTTLSATVSDDGQPTPPTLTLNWTRVSGPGTVTFSAPTNATTTASFSAAGIYVLRLTVSDGALSRTDDVTVTVNGPPVAGSLVAAWGFNEGIGTSLGDSSGNGRTGTVTGATWTTGKYGRALNFDGNDSVVLSDIDLTGSFTVMAWMQTRSLHANGCASLVMKAFDYGFEICEGRLYAGVGTGSNWTAHPSKALTSADLNVWRHVTLTHDGTTLRFYIGGTLVRSAAGTHTSNNRLLRFGRWSSNIEYWNGRIDEVRIYNRALTQAEVQTDMNTPVGN